MKEIITIIRPNKVCATKKALQEIGLPSMTAIPVLGRGKQKGLINEVNIEYRPGAFSPNNNRIMKYIPKRYISIVVSDNMVDRVVEEILNVNKTGEIGDGKIIISPIEDAYRVRTDESGEQAIN